MAWETALRARAAGDARPVWLVPIAWWLTFTGDVRRGLAQELSRLERGVGLPFWDPRRLPGRFAGRLRPPPPPPRRPPGAPGPPRPPGPARTRPTSRRSPR